MPKPKVFVIGLDGATWKILTPLIKAGKLPFLSSQITNGSSGILKSTVPSVSATAWASFQTGVNPGKHGVFNFFNRRHPQGPDTIIDANSIKVPKVWHYLENNGLESLLINMPLSYPPTPLHGILVSSFLTPINGHFVYPGVYEDKLKSMNYQIDIQTNEEWGVLPHHQLSSKELDNLLDECLLIVKKRMQAFRYLEKQQRFDFHFIYFKTTDFMQHLLYNQKPIDRFWHQIDSMLAKLHQTYLKRYGPNQYWITLSDHGFHPSATVQFSAFSWLNQFLPRSTPSHEISPLFQLERQINHHLKNLKVNVINNKWLKKYRQQTVNHNEAQLISTWIHKYQMYPTIEGVYLFGANRKQKLINSIIQKAKTITYMNKPVFSMVTKTKEIYHGDQVVDGPDIIWVPNQDFTLNPSPLSHDMFSLRQTRIFGEHYSDGNGIYTLTGPTIRNRHTEDLDIIDMVPLILHFFGLPKPKILDGRISKRLFKSNQSPPIINTQINTLQSTELTDIKI